MLLLLVQLAHAVPDSPQLVALNALYLSTNGAGWEEKRGWHALHCTHDGCSVNCTDTQQPENCRDWALQGECNKNPSFMHEACARSCNTCEYTLCKDEEAECGNWARGGECSQSRRARTQTRIVLPQGVCPRDQHSNPVRDTDPDFMKVSCARSCGWCASIQQQVNDPCARATVFCDEPGVVTSLSMRNNGMAGTLPTQLGLLAHLETVYMFSNSISGTLPTELGLLTSLRIASICA